MPFALCHVLIYIPTMQLVLTLLSVNCVGIHDARAELLKPRLEISQKTPRPLVRYSFL
jgi:hypothetical protein